MRRSALLCISLCLAPLVLAAQQTTPTPVPPHDSVQGAVRVVDLSSRTLEVTTGVGFALRVVRLAVPAGIPVTDEAKDAPIPLSTLKPGDIVRVLFGGRPARYVAYSIERVGRMETGPDATP